MQTKLNKPKGFGEILDLTFQLSKNKFKDFFLIMLLFMGPVYLLQAIVELAFGKSLFVEMGAGDSWFERILMSFDETSTNIGADLSIALVGLLSIFIFPIASAAVLVIIDRMRQGENIENPVAIRQALSRYWPMLGSNFLFGLVVFGVIFIPLIVVVIAVMIGSLIHIAVAIFLGIILFIGFGVGISYFLTRLSFYFGSVVLDEGTPGFNRSWTLSKQRPWVLLGLYLIFIFIMMSITTALELTFGMFLGNSVLLTVILGLANIFTTLILSVGFAVMYLDLKVRHDADDLKDLIDEYQVNQSNL